MEQLQQTVALINIRGNIIPALTQRILWVSVLLISACGAKGQDAVSSPDTVSLGDVEVKAYAPSGPRRGESGSIKVDAGMYRSVPRVLGEADMLRLLNLLPGVVSASDYASGAAVDGSDFSQHIYRVNGVPVLFPYHFGGIFSTMNPYLYPNASIHKSIHPTGAPSVAGAVVDVWSDTAAAATAGEANVGMLASSIGLRVPAGRDVTVRAGGRVSYISRLYGKLLRNKSSDVSHDFGDADLTVDIRATSRDRISATAHYNDDFLKYSDSNYDMQTRLDWHNLCAGVKWVRESGYAVISTRADYSQTGNKLTLDMSDVYVRIPTLSRQASVAGSIAGLNRGKTEFSAGYSLTGYFESPQRVNMHGFGETAESVESLRESADARVWGRAICRLSRSISIDGGIEMSLFGSQGGYARFNASPRVSLTWNTRPANFICHIGRYRQPVHYVGLSEIGLASDFRYAASRNAPVQHGWHFAASGEWRVCNGELSLGAEAYCKLSEHQAEYVGTVLDMLDADYDAAAHIRSAKGRSYGASVMVKRGTGAVTGWISYSCGVSERRFYGEKQWFTATGDIRHSLKANVALHIGSHWNIGGVFTLASGRPYTPVENIYIISEKLMMNYGKRNSARMPLYHRLDLGASFRWRSKGRMPLEHMLSLSLINAYGHRNIELQSWTFSMESRRYYMRQVASLYRFLPSVSYTLRFGA